MTLAFPEVTAPELSVLLPVHGWGDFLGTTLERLLAHTEPVYELVVVDDASPDGAGARLAESVRGARLLRNERNLGFGPAVMQAAGLARGRLLLLLNSDVFVEPGWLGPLLSALQLPGAGAVSPLLLEPDGRVQESGCLLFRNGYTRFTGYRGDAEDPAWSFPRAVDYASAACLLVRRDAFFAAGGFDPLFFPAYYEDVDLCLSLRAMGWDVLVEPRSRVVHLRGASTPGAVSASSFLRNVALFERRWRGLLAARPEAPGTGEATARSLLDGRDAPARARILVLSGRGAGSSAVDAAHALAGDRSVRVALAPAPKEKHALLASGVEVPGSGPLDAWLRERSFHFDAVVACGSVDRGLEALLAETQPQAARLSPAPDLEAALASAGIAPPGPGTSGYHPAPTRRA